MSIELIGKKKNKELDDRLDFIEKQLMLALTVLKAQQFVFEKLVETYPELFSTVKEKNLDLEESTNG